MSYSMDQTQIRAGLVNYIGAMIASSSFDNDSAKKHSVIAALSEEMSTLAKDKDGYYQMFELKPILRLVSNICRQRIAVLECGPMVKEVLLQIKSYKEIMAGIDNILEKIKY